MEVNEIKKHMNNYEKSIGMEEYFLKYPVDMLMIFNNENIKEKIKDNVVQLFNFKKLFIIADSKYIELKDLYEEVISEQFDWYKFEYDRSLSTDEIKEFYIHKDPKVKQIKRLLVKQKIQKSFFKLCIESLLNQGKRMHDYLKVLELEK